VSDAFTLFTSWQENYGGGPNFNVLNHEGVNTTFPAVQLQSRANLGWEMDDLEIDLFANYTGGYRNWSSNSVAPVLTDANGLPVSGGDVVHSNLTFDAHVAYNFTSDILGGDQVYVDVKNMFSRRPPFYNQSQGYDYFVANPLGRVISLGLRTTF
jgi:iron complex outermembrane receptor protein